MSGTAGLPAGYLSGVAAPAESSADRADAISSAVALFNAGRYWQAHEALERVWRAVHEPAERLVWQGLIQAAAALLHQERGNRHGTTVVGEAAVAKLAGPQHPNVELETVAFRSALAAALAATGPAPRLTPRTT